MTESNQIIFHKEGISKLNTGQKALYLLVCEAVEQKRIIQYNEIKFIYLNCVQQSEHTGFNFYNNETKKWEWKARKKYPSEVKQCFQSWLLRALGTLIEKGFLTVIPRIELKRQLEEQNS